MHALNMTGRIGEGDPTSPCVKQSHQSIMIVRETFYWHKYASMQSNRVHAHVGCRFARQITIVMADVSDEDYALLISSEVRLLLFPPIQAHWA